MKPSEFHLDGEKEEQDCFDAFNEISILPLGYLIHCGAIMWRTDTNTWLWNVSLFAHLGI